MTASQTSTQTTPQNPVEQYPHPPFPEQQQEVPGSERQMQPRPDHGEQSYRGTGKLTGKRALITGGDSGIGKAVALAFAREGADVVISYLSEDDDARDAQRLVQEAGRSAVLVAGDIASEQHCQQLVQRAVSNLGGLDILVNNAAYQKQVKGIGELTAEEWNHHFRVNIDAMFHLCKAAVPHLPPGGAIINTASVEAYQPEPSLLAYATTKGAIVTFTKALAQELIAQGIRVNGVAPGPVWTPLIPATMEPSQAKEFGKQSPMQRPAQPAELAPAFVFLASSEASYIAGEVIGVTGGKPLT